MSETYTYQHNSQFEKYISQFMRVFSGFQYVKDSQGTLERIPVVYGPMDRIVASIMTNRSSFPNQKIPLISAVLSGIEKNEERKRATDYTGSTTLQLSDDGSYTTLQRLIGPAFILNMDLSIMASSTQQLFEILEQILLIFNPRVSIQKSTNIEDQNYNTEITLTGIQDEINYPLGTESKMISMTLNFSFETRLNYPHKFDENIIEKIKTNLYDTTVVSEGEKIEDFEIDESDL